MPINGNNLRGYNKMKDDSNDDNSRSGSDRGGRDGSGDEVRRSRWVEDDS